MPVLLVVLALVVVAAAAILLVGRGGRMPDAPPDLEPADLPDDRPVGADDLDRVRFALAFRGYRMDQVDRVLDAAADRLRGADARIEQLEAALTDAGVEVPPVPEPEPELETELEPESEADEADAPADSERDTGPDSADAEAEAEAEASADAASDDPMRSASGPGRRDG